MGQPADSNGSSTKYTNVWVIAVPFYSHLCRASELAESLAKHGLTVTLLGAKHDVQRFISSRSRTVSSWKRQALDLQLQPLGSPELAAVTGGDGKSGAFAPTVRAYMQILEETLKNDDDMERISMPTFVIAETVLFGLMELFAAAHLDVPVCSFLTFSPSFIASLIYLSEGVMKPPDFPLDKQAQEKLISLPGYHLMRLADVMGAMFETHPQHELAEMSTQLVRNSEHVILHGFKELETRGCHELENLLKSHAAARNNKKVPQVWPIGPLFPLDPLGPETEELRRAEDENLKACMQFLDSQAPSSVVYVAFGVEIGLSQEQILELVYGLERSKQPFLCVLHSPEKSVSSGVQDPLSIIPSDCRERTGSRGLFVEWAPQREILSHPSTGAFMSHCGYGSVLEASSFGVPMIAWPWQYDQFMDCRLVVDELQTGMEVYLGPETPKLVHSEYVTKSIDTLFHSTVGFVVRENALKMKEQAIQSVSENGSSTRNMQALVKIINDAS
ncbi:hypothetical protein R1flu_028921 [Riccia fluitans]|uniref:Glycosyltransferase n=1 Tax=Riccia fluitans TaxID=41844 RepID=A0ABD1XS51_9MARC